MPDTMTDADAAPAKPKERHAPRGQAPRPVICRDDKEELVKWLAVELGDPELRRALTKCSHVVKARNVILARARNKHISAAAESLKHDATANNIVERACAQCSRTKEAAAVLAHWNKLRSWQKGSKKIIQRRAKGNKNEGRPLGFRGKHKKHQSRHSGEGKK
jgi:hypothetical protein